VVLQVQEVDDLLGLFARLKLGRAPWGVKNSSLHRPVLRWVWRPISRLCSTVACSNSSMFWKVRAMPSEAIACGGCGQLEQAQVVDLAGGGGVDAADQVEHGGLAGAVGPIR
jgi:hypothetical protein